MPPPEAAQDEAAAPLPEPPPPAELAAEDEILPEGRWQFPFLGIAILASLFAVLSLWATKPTAAQVEAKWDLRVAQAMDRGDVDAAVQVWRAWQADMPGSILARKWPRRFFTIYANKLSLRPTDEPMIKRALEACEQALAFERIPEEVLALKRARAQMWMDLRRYDEAAEGFADLEDLGAQARALSLGGRLPEAVSLADALLGKADAPAAAVAEGVAIKLRVLADHKDWPGILSLAERARSLPPLPEDLSGRLGLASAEALFELSRAENGSLRQERLDRARKLFERPDVAALFRGAFDPYYLRGEVEYASGLYPQAIATFEKALALRREAVKIPPDADGILGVRIGDAWMRLGDPVKGLAAYQQGFSRGFAVPDERETGWTALVEVVNNLEQMARAWRRDKKWAEALAAKELLSRHARPADRGRHMIELAQLHMDRAEDALALGRSYEAEEDYLHAALIYRQFLEASPFASEYLDLVWRIGLLLKGIGDLPESAEVMREFLDQGRSHPRYGDALYDLGTILKTLGHYEEAIAVFQQNISHFDRSKSMGATFRETGVPRSVYLSRLSLGETLLARARPEDLPASAAAFRANLQDDGIDPASDVWRDSLFGLGRALGRLADGSQGPPRAGFLKEARETWDHFLRRYARYGQPLADGAQAQEYREGRWLLRQALREKGWIEAALGSWESLAADWEQYLKLGEAPPEGALAFTLAEAYNRLGRVRDAEGLYLRLALSDADPFKSCALYRLGDLHRRAGRMDHAREAYRRAAEQAEARKDLPLEAGVAYLARRREAALAGGAK